jgi:hypothetical protein
MESKMVRETWSFSTYLEEIFLLSEIAEIPGIKTKTAELIREMWVKFPTECEAIGLRDGLKN